MKYQSDSSKNSIKIVLRYCQEIETILGLRLGAKGYSLKEKIAFDQGRLPNELKQKIVRIMMLGERATLDSNFKISDLDNFSKKCDVVIQDLNHLADKFYANTFKYNLIYLIKRLWVGLLLFWLTSSYFHSKIAASPSFSSGYKVIFWSSLGLSAAAALLLGLLLKSRHYHQEKLDQILQNLLILVIMLNPLTLLMVAIGLFLLNLLH